MLTILHPAVSALAFFQSTQLNLFEQFLTQAVSGIDSTGITAGMQTSAYVILLVGFLWQVYQSALHGGDVRGLGISLIKYAITAIVIMNYHAVFTALNQGFVNAGNWINSAAGGASLIENWGNDLKTQWSQVSYEKLWGLITGSIAGILDAILVLVAFVLYPLVIAIFGFFYLLYGSILYIFGPIVIALMPLSATNRLAKSYVESVFVWNAWPILYGGFGALLSAVQMGQVGQMLSQNSFLGGLGNLEGSFLLGFVSIIYSLAIAVIPFIARRIVSGDVGGTAATLIGAAAAAVTAGTAALEGVSAGAAAAGTTGTSSAVRSTGTSGPLSAAAAPSGTVSGNQPAAPQRAALSRVDSTPNAPVSRGETTVNASGGAPSAETPGVNSGYSTAFESAPDTAEAHAQQIRDDFAGAVGSMRPKASGSRSTGDNNDVGSISTSASGPSRRITNGRATSQSRGHGAGARKVGLATWGAYHAARLAAYGAVAGKRTLTGVAGATFDAVRDPVGASGNLGGSAGRVAGSIANAATNARRTTQSAAPTVAHPAGSIAQGVDAASSVLRGSGTHVVETVKDVANEAKTQFSVAYNKKRRENEQRS